MHYLIYSSTACIADDDLVEHDKILQSALKTNPVLNLTGFLHREGPYFLQYLEGDVSKIDHLMDLIGRDPRHKDIQVLSRGALEGRLLPDWSMGFVVGNQLALRDMLKRSENGLQISSHNPMELIQFLVLNADSLSERLAA